MIYKDNQDLRRALRAAAAVQGASLAEIARKLDITPQALQDMLRKKHIGFDDIARAATAIDCKLVFDIVPAAGDQATQHNE